MAAGFTLADVHGMTLEQVRLYGEAAERRRRKARTELLFMLRGAEYEKGAFAKLLKASRTATWLDPG